jgi:hypothetical protein
VIVPFVAAGMEERRDLSANGVDTRQVRTLPEITAMASQRQVLGFVRATVLLRDNMLHVVSQLAVLLSKLAILTTIIRATTDEVARGDIHD